jgi:hypothetical protein
MRPSSHPLAALAFMALAVFATAALCADKRETRPVSGFKGIDLAVPGKLEIIQGDTESLTLEGPDDVLADIETVVRDDGILLIRRRNRGGWPWRTELRIVANMKQVESVAITGSGDVYAKSLRGPKLTFAIAGSGNIDVASIDTESAHLVVSGSGDIRVAGRAASVSSNISGSGDIKAPKLEARRATVSIAGAGDIALWVRDSLQVKIAGSGDVRYYGDPSIEKRIVGSGKVERLGPAPS